ncbi:MAG: HprK-related kinase A [Kiloniellaceae bacterium]
MNVSDFTLGGFSQCLAAEGVAIRSGPFVSRIVASLPELAAPLYLLYADFPVEDGGIIDFHVRLEPAAGLRRWVRPQAEFLFDGRVPFPPFPRRMALPMLEWALNRCISSHAYQFLIIHAAVIEKDGRALLLPGPAGTGKSTLCAALVSRGWRLLSDELALVRPDDGKLSPVTRSVSLKNQSIDVIRQFAPDAVFGPEIKGTHKGRVAHMRPPTDSVRRADETSAPGWLVFPTFQSGAATHLTPLARARAFIRLADSSFNYHILGLTGFRALCHLIDTSACYEFTYSSVGEAVTLLGDLRQAAPVIRT